MSDRVSLDDPNYNQNQNRVTIQDNKAKALWVVLGIIAAILIIATIVLQSGNSGGNGGSSNSNSLDPNRTTESCLYYGSTKVFGSAHTSRVHCITDGDGYYNPSFGHHHHK